MKKVTFRKDCGDLRLMAIFIAKLLEQGVGFEIKELGNEAAGEWFEIELTGGF